VDRREEIALRARRYIAENHNEAVVVELLTKALSMGYGTDARPSDQLGQAGAGLGDAGNETHGGRAGL